MTEKLTDKMRLFHYWRSSSSWRVRMALAFKKIPVEYVAVNLLSDEAESTAHLSRNPFGYVPVLETSKGNLAESVAIIEWLEENYPTPALFSGDSYQRALTRTFCEYINAGIQPIHNLNVMDHIYPTEMNSDPTHQQKRQDWVLHFVRKGFTAYQALAKEYSGDFTIGNQVTAADLFLIPQCYAGMRFGMKLVEFPLIERVHSNMMEQDFVKSTHPEIFKPND